MTPIAIRILTITLVFALACAETRAQKAAAALADREANYAADEWGYLYYLDLDPWVGEDRTDLERAIKLVVAQTSLEPVIEKTIPAALPGTSLMRIDLRDLGWRYEDWLSVMADYPYDHYGNQSIPIRSAQLSQPTVFGQQRRGQPPARTPTPPPVAQPAPVIETTLPVAPAVLAVVPPLIVRADWLLIQLADFHESKAYHLLLYGANQPKTRDDILKRLGVSSDPLLAFGLIEGQSGVSKQGVRWIENRAVLRAYAWGTRDILKVAPGKDPLENPDGKFQHDGEEWIIGVPKLSKTTGDRGTLQVYFLANGQGNIVDRAPVDLVEDKTEFRGKREIRSPGSCIQCHETGLNNPTTNEFRALIDAGVGVYADKRAQGSLEAFHLSNLKRELERGQDDYQTMVELICGASAPQTAASFKRIVRRYDAPLTLDLTADELGVSVQDWAEALAGAHDSVGARLAGLVHQRTIPREAWEDHYVAAVKLLNQ